MGLLNIVIELGPLAQRMLRPDQWRQALAADSDDKLESYCPEINLPQITGQFEIVCHIGSHQHFESAVCLPFEWRAASHCEADELPDLFRQLAVDACTLVKVDQSEYQLVPRGWRAQNFEVLSDCASVSDIRSGFAPAAAALDLLRFYPGMAVVPTVFATGVGNLAIQRLEFADDVASKRRGAEVLAQRLAPQAPPVQFYAVGTSATLPTNVHEIEPHLPIPQALLLLKRAMVAEPADDAADQAFDAYFQLLERSEYQNDFFARRIIPRLVLRHENSTFDLPNTLITVGSGTIQPPACVAALVKATRIYLLHTAETPMHKVEKCRDYVKQTMSMCHPDLSDILDIKPRQVDEHSFEGVMRSYQQLLHEIGDEVVLDSTAGSKLFSLVPAQLRSVRLPMVYLEQVGFGDKRQPMKNRLVKIPLPNSED